ncbi:hypothetical protein LTS18_007318 [Coniosporium uncinatum]|uniref:Uncharacterized protein n=1 Tax=Coniosporium uncinatum TaxID=93489 RepID=A0ACC3D2M8_9PEZI|nr:hypothetical protein LTS18_007318 [Coniosporium uncinatum]
MVKRTSSGVRMRAADAPPLGRETFQILVDKKATPFAMHKNLVSSSSLFFKAAINGNWKESEEGILGDKFQDHRFQNAIVDALIDSVTEFKVCPTGQARDVYDSLPEGSLYRKILVDFYVWVHNKSWYVDTGDCETGPREFFFDIAKASIEAGSAAYAGDAVYPWVKDRCQYHIHPEGSPKCTQE